jgi:hypothetical protein
MKNLASLSLLFTITLIQLANFEPVKADIGRSGDEKLRACIEACQAFVEQSGPELRACLSKCELRR